MSKIDEAERVIAQERLTSVQIDEQIKEAVQGLKEIDKQVKLAHRTTRKARGLVSAMKRQNKKKDKMLFDEEAEEHAIGRLAREGLIRNMGAIAAKVWRAHKGAKRLTAKEEREFVDLFNQIKSLYYTIQNLEHLITPAYQHMVNLQKLLVFEMKEEAAEDQLER